MRKTNTQTLLDETKTPIEILVGEYGSKAAIGRILEVSRGAVSAWGEYIPPEHAITIERISNGKFKAVDLAGVAA